MIRTIPHVQLWHLLCKWIVNLSNGTKNFGISWTLGLLATTEWSDFGLSLSCSFFSYLFLNADHVLECWRFWYDEIMIESNNICKLIDCLNCFISCFCCQLTVPQFVGSFDMGDYVYFFFRESAVEYMNCGTAVYARVARVCKVCSKSFFFVLK